MSSFINNKIKMNIETFKLFNRADFLQNSFLNDQNVQLVTYKETLG